MTTPASVWNQFYEVMGYRNPRIRRSLQQRPLVLPGESLLTGCLPKRISRLVAEWPNAAVANLPKTLAGACFQFLALGNAAKNRDNRLSFALTSLPSTVTTRHEGDIVLGAVSQ